MTTLCKLRAIQSAIWHTKELIELLDADGSYVNGFATPELRELFYALNSASIRITEMREAIEAYKEVAP